MDLKSRDPGFEWQLLLNNSCGPFTKSLEYVILPSLNLAFSSLNNFEGLYQPYFTHSSNLSTTRQLTPSDLCVPLLLLLGNFSQKAHFQEGPRPFTLHLLHPLATSTFQLHLMSYLSPLESKFHERRGCLSFLPVFASCFLSTVSDTQQAFTQCLFWIG